MKPTLQRTSSPSGSLFLLPWLIGVAVLVFAPLMFAWVLSFVEWDGSSQQHLSWVGSQHYRELLFGDAEPPETGIASPSSSASDQQADPMFYKAMRNSVTFSVFAVPLSLFSAFALAMLLNAPLRGIAWFRSLFYMPHVLGGVATVLIWSWVLNPAFGPLNSIIQTAYDVIDPVVRLFHKSGTAAWPLPGWLMSKTWCKPAVVLIHVWTTGGAVFIFLAALQRVDPDTHLAAHLDGANAWQRLRLITLPQLTPAILFNLITGLVASMQSFNYAYLLYNRAQEDGLLFVSLQIYRTAFEPPYRLGYASAMACILFVLLLGVSLFAFWSRRIWVHYES